MLSSPSLENRLRHWNDTISKNPTNIKAYIQRGMVYFQLAQIDESIGDFDKAEQLDPEIKPYLWQRGLSYYYAERFVEGAQQFEIDLTVNSQDVEETVWRYLCIARLEGIEAARNTLLPVKNDPRQVMRYIYDLYADNYKIDDIVSISESQGKQSNFYSHLYLGLYYEAQNDTENASKYIVKAADKYQINDYMCHLAQVHKILRNW
jgi:tetratricopeptide (TPR) repeat protein